jgi:hypothetical protein
VGEILALERGKNRALYRVMWIGKRGTPQQDQIGVQCVEQGKVMWDEMLEELEEQYEPVLAGLGEQIKAEDGTVEVAPGSAQVQVFNQASGQPVAKGELIGLSYGMCAVKTEDKVPPRTSVQILITSADLDLRLRGQVLSSDVQRVLRLGLHEIRRGDRHAFGTLLATSAIKSRPQK